MIEKCPYCDQDLPEYTCAECGRKWYWKIEKGLEYVQCPYCADLAHSDKFLKGLVKMDREFEKLRQDYISAKSPKQK